MSVREQRGGLQGVPGLGGRGPCGSGAVRGDGAVRPCVPRGAGRRAAAVPGERGVGAALQEVAWPRGEDGPRGRGAAGGDGAAAPGPAADAGAAGVVPGAGGAVDGARRAVAGPRAAAGARRAGGVAAAPCGGATRRGCGGWPGSWRAWTRRSTACWRSTGA